MVPFFAFCSRFDGSKFKVQGSLFDSSVPLSVVRLSRSPVVPWSYSSQPSTIHHQQFRLPSPVSFLINSTHSAQTYSPNPLRKLGMRSRLKNSHAGGSQPRLLHVRACACRNEWSGENRGGRISFCPSKLINHSRAGSSFRASVRSLVEKRTARFWSTHISRRSKALS